MLGWFGCGYPRPMLWNMDKSNQNFKVWCPLLQNHSNQHNQPLWVCACVCVYIAAHTHTWRCRAVQWKITRFPKLKSKSFISTRSTCINVKRKRAWYFNLLLVYKHSMLAQQLTANVRNRPKQNCNFCVQLLRQPAPPPSKLAAVMLLVSRLTTVFTQ